MDRFPCSMLVGAMVLAGCASSSPREVERAVVPPFRPDRVAWGALVYEHEDLQRPETSVRGARPNGLRDFYRVVDQRRPSETSPARKRACTKAWRGLKGAQRSSPAISDELKVGMAYLATQCSWPQKAIPLARAVIRRHDGTDLTFYAAHFFWAEAHLEMEQADRAARRYRYVLGEIDSPLYPLALYRTAHCHWDAGESERAQEYLQHVIDWAGERRAPAWVVALRRRAVREHRDFVE